MRCLLQVFDNALFVIIFIKRRLFPLKLRKRKRIIITVETATFRVSNKVTVIFFS